jgi:prolyl oligopeptidase
VTDITTVTARRSDQVDDYHGEAVADPYRWLEDTNSAETATWIAAENELTESWLSGVPAREEIRERLSQLWDYPRVSAPLQRGERWFQQRNSGLQNHDVLYVMDGP